MISLCKLYRFLDKEGHVIYLGRTTQDLNKRIGAHGHLPLDCYKRTEKIEYAECNSMSDMCVYESYYINMFKPEFNLESKCSDALSIELPELKWNTYKNCCFTKKLKEENFKIKEEKIIEFILKNGRTMLRREDREEFINIVNVRNDGHIKRNINLINAKLCEENLPYRIEEFQTSRMIDGKKKNYKAAWRIVQVE